MSRHHSEYAIPAGSGQSICQEIHQYLLQEGYTFRERDGESVFQKGMGLAMGPTFLKVMCDDSRVIVEAWIKFAALPGVYLGEMGLSGSAGALPKAAAQKRVDAIDGIIRRWGGTLLSSGDIDPAKQSAAYVPPATSSYAPPSAPYTPPAAPYAPPYAAPSDKSFCASCGAELETFAAFCCSCGAPVGQKSNCCPVCKQSVQPGQSFCAGCGTKLS